jgi:hypothetical protein
MKQFFLFLSLLVTNTVLLAQTGGGSDVNVDVTKTTGTTTSTFPWTWVIIGVVVLILLIVILNSGGRRGTDVVEKKTIIKE